MLGLLGGILGGGDQERAPATQGLLSSQRGGNNPGDAAMGLMNNNPMMMMMIGSALMQAGQSGNPNGSLASISNMLQSMNAMRMRQQEFQQNQAMRNQQLEFQKEKFAQDLAHRRAALDVQRSGIGLQQQRFNLSRQQAELVRQQHENRQKAIENLRNSMNGVQGEAPGVRQTAPLLAPIIAPNQKINAGEAPVLAQAATPTAPSAMADTLQLAMANPMGVGLAKKPTTLANNGGAGLLAGQQLANNGGDLDRRRFLLSNAANFLQAGAPGAAVQMIDKALPRKPMKLTPLQKNLIGAGLQPGTPEFKEAVLRSITKPAAESTLEKKMIEADVRKAERYTKAAETAARNMVKISQFKQAIGLFNTGRFADTRLSLSQLDQTFGGIFTDPSTVAAGELVRTFGTDFMLQFVAQTKGAISERENKMFLKASPGLDKTPQGNLLIANAMEAVNQRIMEKSEFMRTYLNTNKTLTGAEKAWGQFISENQLVNKDFSVNKDNISNWQAYLQPGRSRSTVSSQPRQTADPLGLR